MTNVGGLPETVRDGVDGFVVEPTVEAVGAAMRTLWDDPAKAHAMGRAACAHVAADFSWNAVVGRCLRAYESF